MKKLADFSAMPAREYRPWAIWIWNQHITADDLESQLNSIIDKGFGGVAVRPGRDMDPSYMSAEFLDSFGKVLDTAKRKNIGVRIADDLAMPWCNVFAATTQSDPAARMRKLVLDEVVSVGPKGKFEKDDCGEESHIVLAVKQKKDKLDLSQVKELPLKPTGKGGLLWKPTGGDWTVVVLRKEYACDATGGYVPNTFNSKVADAYIKDYLEPLKSRFSKFVPTTFEGFVNEQPIEPPGDNAIPWDDSLPVRYRSKYKKELIKLLPSLFLDVAPEDVKHRSHIYHFLTQSMFEGFAEPLEKWGRKTRFSHWLLCPERGPNDTAGMLTSFSILPEGSFAHVGLQNLEGSRKNEAILRSVADMNATEYRRQTVSVVGRNRLCQASTIQDLKNELDQHACLGSANILVDGLFANLDHRTHVRTPFNMFWYSSDWEAMKPLCSYAGRLQSAVQNLHSTRDIAVLSPDVSAIAEYRPDNADGVGRALDLLKETVQELDRSNLSFDVISESTLLSCSVRTNGEFGTSDRVRKGNYGVLVIPYCRLISKGVFVFLEKLAAKRGAIFFVGDYPAGSLDEGVTPTFSSRVDHLLKSKRGTVRVVLSSELATLGQRVPTPVKVSAQGNECPDIAITYGADAGNDVYCLRNTSDYEEYFAAVEMPAHNHLYLADCTRGAIVELTHLETKDGQASVDLTFLPSQSYVLIGSKNKVSAAVDRAREKKHPINIYERTARNYRVVLRNQWKFTPQSLNVLPLSSWSTRIGLSRELGGYSHYCETYFEAKELPSMCWLVFNEFPGLAGKDAGIEASWEIAVNGNPVVHFQEGLVRGVPGADGEQEPSPIVDNTLFASRAVSAELREFLVKSYNRIAIRSIGLTGDPPAILYPPLLVGDFPIERGARGWAMGKAIPPMGNDSWARYGFPYLSGTGTYTQVFEVPSEYERLVMAFSQVSGPIRVAINDNDLGVLRWQPMELDVTKACTAKRNELSVEVVNTVDNVLRMNGRTSGLTGDVHLDIY